MDRRAFTRGLVSLGLAPAAPLGALGAQIATGTATAASATAEHMYFVSWYTARLNKTCSMDTLVTELNMDVDVAREVFGKLVRSNTLSAPDTFGVSKTLDPLRQNLGRATGAGAGHTAGLQPHPATSPQVAKPDPAALSSQAEVAQSDPLRDLADALPADDAEIDADLGLQADADVEQADGRSDALAGTHMSKCGTDGFNG